MNSKNKCYTQPDKKNKADKILSERIQQQCFEFIPCIVDNITENIINDIENQKKIQEKQLKRLRERQLI